MKRISMVLLGLLCLIYLEEAEGEASISLNNNANPHTEFCECAIKKELTQLNERVDKLEKSEQSQKEKIDGLQEELRKIKATPRVAFTAKLSAASGHIYLGPFNTVTIVAFPNVILNMGNAYNPSTGIFTAQEKGVYYFSFTVFKNSNSNPLFASLMKNNVKVISYWDSDNSDIHDSSTNMAIMQLEVGDNVYIRLHENRQIYDDTNWYSSFSGFLLYLL